MEKIKIVVKFSLWELFQTCQAPLSTETVLMEFFNFLLYVMYGFERMILFAIFISELF